MQIDVACQSLLVTIQLTPALTERTRETEQSKMPQSHVVRLVIRAPRLDVESLSFSLSLSLLNPCEDRVVNTAREQFNPHRRYSGPTQHT